MGYLGRSLQAEAVRCLLLEPSRPWPRRHCGGSCGCSLLMMLRGPAHQPALALRWALRPRLFCGAGGAQPGLLC